MVKETVRARIVALGILLAFTLTVYFTWRANEDWTNASSREHVRIVNPGR